ncbi:hypothetical protein ACFSHR_03380 [Azotobacter chroococcum]
MTDIKHSIPRKSKAKSRWSPALPAASARPLPCCCMRAARRSSPKT